MVKINTTLRPIWFPWTSVVVWVSPSTSSRAETQQQPRSQGNHLSAPCGIIYNVNQSKYNIIIYLAPKHCHVPSCTRHKLGSRSSVLWGGGRGALGTAGARSMGSEVICLGLYERPDGAVGSAEGPTRTLCIVLYIMWTNNGIIYNVNQSWQIFARAQWGQKFSGWPRTSRNYPAWGKNLLYHMESKQGH